MKERILFRLYSTAEASAFTGIDKRKIKKEREHKVLENVKLEFSDLLYLHIIQKSTVDLAVPIRKHLKKVIDSHKEDPENGESFLGSIPCNLQPAEDDLVKVIQSFLEWKDDLHTEKQHGREMKYVSGSNATVKDLLAAKTPEEQARLFSKNPELGPEDVNHAIMYKAAYPRG